MKSLTAWNFHPRQTFSVTALLLLAVAVTCGAQNAASTDHTLRAAAVVFQQDEFELLSDWIQYHGAILGHNNLYIIDNNSRLPSVLNTLELAEKMGVTVVRDDNPFTEKHNTLTRTMHEVFSNDSTIDIVIPLDADEFVVTGVAHGFSAAPDAVLATIGSLPVDGFKYKFQHIQAAACPASYLVPYSRRVLNANMFSEPTLHSRHKTFYHREGFLSTDQGNHYGSVEMDAVCESESDEDRELVRDSEVTVEKGACFHKSPLAIIHYGNHGLTFEAFKAKMKRGFEAYHHSLEGDCIGGGKTYCIAWKSILADEQSERRKHNQVACRDSRVHSTFVSSALLGDHAGVLQYPKTVELP